MGPFQEYEEKKSPEKGSPRSRIPRLVLHPFRPKDKGSPSASESPTSEEEGKDCDLSSDSKRTISTNSFCSGSEQSPAGSPLLGAQRRQPVVKRVRLMGECGGERGGERSGERGPSRHKRQQRSAIKSTKGSEADFSSSSSTRSLKTKDSRIPGSAGKQTPRSRTTRTRPLPAFKPAGSPIANRDSELFAPYQTPPRACASSSITTTSSSSSSNSSPTARRLKLGRYHSCGDNHGILAPHPEQYLTPLQQKEVNIRHLKTKLMESENVIHDREADIEELKSQLGRMREDWIEEECHRVEAQLSLKEARKEIRQLRQVVETMKSSLMEKDKGIQKYFVDINIQNRKLESLLQSMELAQSGSNLQDEPSLDFLLGDIPDGGGGGKTKLEEEGGEALGDQAAEEMADSGLLLNDEMANRVDILERVLMSTAVDFSQDIGCKLRPGEGPAVSTLLEEDKGADKSIAVPKNLFSAPDQSASGSSEPPKAENKEMQTEMQTETPAPPDLRALLLQLLKLHGQTVGDASVGQLGDPDLLTPFPLPTHAATTTTAATTDSTPSPAPTESPEGSGDSGMCSAAEPGDVGGGAGGCRFMEELDFSVCEGGAGPGAAPQPGAAEGKRYWSDSFLVDLVAVAAPVLPTVAWLYSRHGVDGSAPVYNIAALIRGCCIMGLRSLRRVA